MQIYKQYDQDALDRQYNNRLHVPDFAIHLGRWNLLSRQTEKDFPAIKDMAYGDLPRERLDIYPSPMPLSKTMIFIHGGYWQRFDKRDFQFIARAFHSRDVTTVIINYPLTPGVSLDEIVSSCTKAVCWVCQNISDYNGNPAELYFTGHSAGGQIAAMLMATNWKRFDMNPDVIKGACLISGIFNLIPILLSDLNHTLGIDREMALRNSPVKWLPVARCPLALIFGGDETDEFRDQSHELYSCWKDQLPVTSTELKGLNHFSILETILDPGSDLYHVTERLLQ